MLDREAEGSQVIWRQSGQEQAPVISRPVREGSQVLPSVSRDVHYRIMDRCVAAKVTAINDDRSVALFLFPPPDLALSGSVHPVHEGAGETQWHWPERV